jgi:hypothetical protein
MGKPSLSNLTSASYFFFLKFSFFFFFGSFYDFFGGGLGSFCTFFFFLLRFLVSPVWRPDFKSSSPATLDRVMQTAGGVYSLLA